MRIIYSLLLSAMLFSCTSEKNNEDSKIPLGDVLTGTYEGLVVSETMGEYWLEFTINDAPKYFLFSSLYILYLDTEPYVIGDKIYLPEECRAYEGSYRPNPFPDRTVTSNFFPTVLTMKDNKIIGDQHGFKVELTKKE